MRAPLTLLLCATLAACGARDTLTPGQWTGYVPAAESEEFEIRVRLAAGPAVARAHRHPAALRHHPEHAGKSSTRCATNAGAIMRAIRASNPNSAFGVASFADYQERMPWRLDRDITEDLDSVSAAITRLRLYDGKDFPEAYSRALHEARFVGWRPGARRFIVLFGDAPAHDPNFYGQSTGVDPGRDGIPGNEDDLRFAEVVRDLAVDRITVLVNYVPGDPLARKGFEFLAAQTGGAAIPVSDAKQVSTAIVAGLNEQSFARPTVRDPAGVRRLGPRVGRKAHAGRRPARVRLLGGRERAAARDGRDPPLSAGREVRGRHPQRGDRHDPSHDPHRLAVPPGLALAPARRWCCWCCCGGCAAPGVAARASCATTSSPACSCGCSGSRCSPSLIYVGWRHLEGAEHLLPDCSALGAHAR